MPVVSERSLASSRAPEGVQLDRHCLFTCGVYILLLVKVNILFVRKSVTRMCPKYSRRGYLPRNKPLSNRLRVRNIISKRKASKRSRPTSPPDHPPRRDHPPRAFSPRALSSARDARSFRSARYVTAPPAATRPDCSLTRPRPRGPAAGHEEFKRTLAPRRSYTFRLCDYDRRRRVPRVPTQLCAAPRCPPAPLDGSIPTPPFTRDPPPDRPPSRPPRSRSPGINLVAV